MVEENDFSSAYAEVLALIDALVDWYRNQIPQNLIDTMEAKKDPNAVFHFHANDTDAKFSKEALALIAWLNLEYWCKDEEEKKRLQKIYQQNEEKEKLERYKRLLEQED